MSERPARPRRRPTRPGSLTGSPPSLAVAVGRLAGGPWVGFRQAADGYRLACGARADEVRVSAALGADRMRELLAVAASWFEEALDPAPPELEATQADLGGLVRWLADQELDTARRAVLARAVDAIDDGLAPDAVLARLGAIIGPETDEQADPVDLLEARCAALGVPAGAPSVGG